MSAVHSITLPHNKKVNTQENITDDQEKKSVEEEPQMTQILELVDKEPLLLKC